MRKPVSLVLSSGGARGMAQIGVIEGLEQLDYEIKSIAGSSIGAFVGGMYAHGKLEAYKNFVCNLDKLDVFKLIDFTFSTSGFIRGERIINELTKRLDDGNIEDFKIHFAAVATDIVNNEEVIFEKGSLFYALRASTAIPTVIKPILSEHRLLVDGGVLNPIPIKHVKRTPGDLLVVVNVNHSSPYARPRQTSRQEQKRESDILKNKTLFMEKWLDLFPNKKSAPKKLGFFDLMNRSIDLMQDQLSTLILDSYKPDIVVNISRKVCGTFEFYRSGELIELGRKTFLESHKNYLGNECADAQ